MACWRSDEKIIAFRPASCSVTLILVKTDIVILKVRFVQRASFSRDLNGNKASLFCGYMRY